MWELKEDLCLTKYCTWVHCNDVSWFNLPEDNPAFPVKPAKILFQLNQMVLQTSIHVLT